MVSLGLGWDPLIIVKDILSAISSGSDLYGAISFSIPIFNQFEMMPSGFILYHHGRANYLRAT
jgi:hypothetical protein